jgi:Fe2+ transport system protein B
MTNPKAQLKTGFIAGLKTGWHSFVWMCEIIIPVSFLVTLLQWSGWLDKINFVLNPLMSFLNLPPEAALPIITGILINIYAVIAVVTVLPFTVAQMTLIAIFTLICHNLIMEGIVQYRSGINIVKATLTRIVAAVLTVFVVSQFFGDTSQSTVMSSALLTHTPPLEILKTWAIDTAILLSKVFGIIMFIMILLEISRALGWIDRVLKVFKPIMRVLGLADRTAIMFVAGIVFGLLYGGAIIVEEGKKGTLAREEVEYLHISLGINHAMIEDPALFAVLGVNILWLWIPRLIMAIIAVQAYRGINHLRKTRLPWSARIK